MGNPDARFRSRVIAGKILAQTEPQLGLNLLLEILDNITKDTFLAILHYEIWKLMKKLLNEKSETHRKIALMLHQKLFSKTPDITYKHRIEELEIGEKSHV